MTVNNDILVGLHGRRFGFTADGRLILDGQVLSPVLGRIPNVRDDYGAAGDGTADDTAALQAALAANQNIYVPAGSYKHTAPLALLSNQRIFGAGRAVSILKPVGCDGITSAASNEKCSIADLSITGNGTASTYGVNITDNPRGFSAQRVYVSTFGTAGNGGGVYLNGSGAANMWGALLEQVEVESCGRGIVTNGDAATTLLACISRLNKGDPLFCTSMNRGAIIGGTYENCLAAQGASNSIALHFVTCNGVFVAGIYSENVIDSLLTLDACYDMCVQGAVMRFITNNSGTLISLVNGSSRNTIRGEFTGMLAQAGRTGVSLDSTSINNDIAITVDSGGSVPAGTVLSDSSSGGTNNIDIVLGRTGTRTRKVAGFAVGSGSDVLDTFVKAGTFTPSVSFATPGDFSASNTTAAGIYEQVGKMVRFSLEAGWDSNAFTTASGALTISGLPATAKNNGTIFYYPCEMAAVKMTYSASTTSPKAVVISNTSTVQIFLQQSAGAFAASSTTNFPASTTGFKLYITGSYEAA